jgi:hypothetical protein
MLIREVSERLILKKGEKVTFLTFKELNFENYLPSKVKTTAYRLYEFFYRRL